MHSKQTLNELLRVTYLGLEVLDKLLNKIKF